MKKALSLLLALSMLLCLLAGCGDKSAETSETKTNTEASSSEPVSDDERLPLVKNGEHKVITIGLMQNANVIDYDTNEYTLFLEEKTGIDLEFVCFSTNANEAKQQLTLMIAGGEELPDILWGFSGIGDNAVQEFGQDGYFVDLKPLYDEYGYWMKKEIERISFETDRDRIIKLGVDPDSGAMYGMPKYERTQGMDITANHVVINTKWLDAVGETMPKTPEDLKRILIKFRDMDPNGNGIQDEIPMIGSTSASMANVMEWILSAYTYVCDNYLYNVDANGKIWAPHTTDEYRQGLIYLNDLYKEGLLSPMVFSIKSVNEMKEFWTPTNGTPICGVVSSHVMVSHNPNSELVFDYQVIPVLDAGTGKGGYHTLKDASFSYKTFITEDCDDPVLAFKLLDYMSSEESFVKMRYGMEGRDWERAKEGMLDQFGVQAAIVILDSTAWTMQNNTNWHAINGCIFDSANYTYYSMSADEAKSFEERVELWYDKALEDLISPPDPDKVLLGMVWPADKIAERTEYSSQVWSYVEQARALFVTGEMDPNKDSDWQTYLDELEAMGFYKLMELYQENYDKYNAE